MKKIEQATLSIFLNYWPDNLNFKQVLHACEVENLNIYADESGEYTDEIEVQELYNNIPEVDLYDLLVSTKEKLKLIFGDI